jgi:hypothetical protein
MNYYQQLISDATGIVDIDRVRMVENYMRLVYFQSTLNWQDVGTLTRAAQESAAEVADGGWTFR